jgi:hypothetical protein
MTTTSFMPNTDTGKADLLDHLAAKLPHYVEMLDISADDLAALKAYANSFRYALQPMGDMQAYARRQLLGSASPIQATY